MKEASMDNLASSKQSKEKDPSLTKREGPNDREKKSKDKVQIEFYKSQSKKGTKDDGPSRKTIEISRGRSHEESWKKLFGMEYSEAWGLDG